jgi:hypothetical protein
MAYFEIISRSWDAENELMYTKHQTCRPSVRDSNQGIAEIACCVSTVRHVAYKYIDMNPSNLI